MIIIVDYALRLNPQSGPQGLTLLRLADIRLRSSEIKTESNKQYENDLIKFLKNIILELL